MRVITEEKIVKVITEETTIGVEVNLTLEEYTALVIVLGCISGKAKESSIRSVTATLRERLLNDLPSPIEISGFDPEYLKIYGERAEIHFTECSRENTHFQNAVEYYRSNLR